MRYGYICGGVRAVAFLLMTASHLLSGMTQHVGRITRALSSMAEGDCGDIPDTGESRGEVRNMYHTKNEMKGQLKDMMSNTKESILNLLSMSDKFSSSCSNFLINTDGNLQKTGEIENIVSSLSRTLTEMATNASNISETIEEVYELILCGRETNTYAMSSIGCITTVFNDAQRRWKPLGAVQTKLKNNICHQRYREPDNPPVTERDNRGGKGRRTRQGLCGCC